MPTHQERRKSERVASLRACPYALTKPMVPNAVLLTAGHAYSINSSAGGMLLLLPGAVLTQHVVEVQVSSETRKASITKLGEVCWTHSISVEGRVCMYLAGIHFMFEIPALE
ncbi:hypothetical protein AYO43_09210 [Nitrospira sp. SCGC AG-212-E16]|nr:hypothetical protein AYO43_09210 [Nitrospira sp. SCGC AG-212-E16]